MICQLNDLTDTANLEKMQQQQSVCIITHGIHKPTKERTNKSLRQVAGLQHQPIFQF